MSKTTSTVRELKDYANRLRELTAQVRERISRLEAEALAGKRPAATGEEPPAHEADPATRDSEDQVALKILESEKQVLTESEAALERIAAGTFGKCEHCGHAIGHARLEVVPYARHCVQCAATAAS